MRKKKILLVEDDPDTRDMVAIILEDGEQIELLKPDKVPDVTEIAESGPDLILLDERLPGKSGSALCLELKSKKPTAHIPVVLVSAAWGLEDIARQCHADGVISKPFDIEQLKQVVSGCLAVA
jgi:CheY-like chemotaxis protein